MADPALWWSYRRRLFIHDSYQKAKSHLYCEFFGDKLLSAICITYLESWGLPFAMINALHLFITSNANWERWSSSIPFIKYFASPADAFEVLAFRSLSPPPYQVLSSNAIPPISHFLRFINLSLDLLWSSGRRSILSFHNDQLRRHRLLLPRSSPIATYVLSSRQVRTASSTKRILN